MIIDKDNAFGSRRSEEERGRGRGVDVIIMGHTQTQIRIVFSPLCYDFSTLVPSDYDDDQRLYHRCWLLALPSRLRCSGFCRCHRVRSAPALASTLRHLSGAHPRPRASPFQQRTTHYEAIRTWREEVILGSEADGVTVESLPAPSDWSMAVGRCKSIMHGHIRHDAFAAGY